jgi:hypothetical protein
MPDRSIFGSSRRSPGVDWRVVSAASSRRKAAVVIGNGAYHNVTQLPNPRNDANDIAASLARLNFSVNKMIDGTFEDMRRVAAWLRGRRCRHGRDLLIGSRHEDRGREPTDQGYSRIAAPRTKQSLESAMYQVANGSRLSLVVLDAYRNNPFAAKMQRSVRARSVDLGLVCVEPSNNVLSPRRERGTVASDAMVNTAHSRRRCSTTRRQRVGDQLPFPECATRSSRRPSANSNPSFTGRFETDDLSERAYGESTRCGAIEPASSNRDRASSAVDARHDIQAELEDFIKR